MTQAHPDRPAAVVPSLFGQLRNAAAAILGHESNEAAQDSRREPHLAGGEPEPIAPLVDPERLQILSRLRPVLRQRDSTHEELLRAAHAAQARMTREVDSRIDRLGLMQRLQAPTSDTVLADWLRTKAMLPIETCWRRERVKLAGLQAGNIRLRSSDFIFEPSVAWLAQERFRAGNRDVLIQKLQQWLLGPKGPAAHYATQASQMADALMHPETPC